jgi:hypothetical protein
MRVYRFRTLPILVLSGFLAATIQSAYADPTGPADPSVTSFATNPQTSSQIVRLSFVQGDVRISRGKQADKQDHDSTGWEQAVSNLPVESGDSIVTGIGRAEIEFEDASTVYLADNSVLTFTQLTSTSGVPYTEIALLSGTATMNVHPMVKGEWFRLSTPTDTISLPYPRKAVWRVDSYLDSVSITPQRDPSIAEPELVAAQSAMLGRTSSYNHGKRVTKPVTTNATVSAEWDNWVATRLRARTEAMNTAMKQAGLKSPIPGLAEMNGQGHFFACEPYGTCWESANGWKGKATDVAEVKTQAGAAAPQNIPTGQAAVAAAPPAASAAKTPKQSASDLYLAAHPGATLYTEDYFFPCNTFAVQDLIGIDPITGKQDIVDTYFDLNMYMDPIMYPAFGRFPYRRYGLFMDYDAWGFAPPWEWAICHTGSWIRWQHHYVWVAGTKRHHHCPVRWVRNGHNVGFVPIHPKDIPGKPPINLKDGLFKMTGKKDQPVAHVPFEQGKFVYVLDQPPREFRGLQLEPLKAAVVPHAEAHSAFEVAHSGDGPHPSKDAVPVKGTVFAGSAMAKNPEVRSQQSSDHGTPITFDRKSQTFSIARQVNEGGKPTTVSEPLSGRSEFPAGYNGPQGRPTSSGGGYSNGGNSSRSYTPSQSYNGGNSNNAGASRSYSPPPSYSGGNSNNGGGSRSYSPPSSPSPSPAPSYSPPAASSSAPASPSKH